MNDTCCCSWFYYEDHNPPHFHAEYNGHKALIDINEARLLKGALPAPKRLQAIRDKVAHKDGELREKIVKLQLELIHINNKKICDLITNENVDAVLRYQSKTRFFQMSCLLISLPSILMLMI